MIPLKPITGKKNDLQWQIKFDVRNKFLLVETSGIASFESILTLNRVLFNDAFNHKTRLILMDYTMTDINLSVDEVCALSGRTYPLVTFAMNRIALLVKKPAMEELSLKLLQAILKRSMIDFKITSGRSDAEAWLTQPDHMDRIVVGLS